jgi:phospholipid/cholesterol/gamma-HCH transport system substrate-binding protein
VAAAGETANGLLRDDVRPMVGDLRSAIAAATQALKQVEQTAAAAQPGAESFSRDTIPEANRLIRQLQDVSQALGAVSAKLDEDPLGAMVGGRRLPDYQPEDRKK